MYIHVLILRIAVMRELLSAVSISSGVCVLLLSSSHLKTSRVSHESNIRDSKEVIYDLKKLLLYRGEENF